MQWEYVVLRMTDHNWAAQMTELNQFGRDGWELVAMDDGVAYMKRERRDVAILGVTVTTAEEATERTSHALRSATWVEIPITQYPDKTW